MENITVQTAAERLKQSQARLVDVRTPAEFGVQHALGAVNIPLDRLSADELARELAGETSVMFICQRGGRSKQACERILSLGRYNLSTVEGGTDAWSAANLPLELGHTRVISLERQVRIAAGVLVLLGVVLSVVISHLFLALSAFVGAGLIFAGVTDRCGMGLLLSRMPWNQRCA